MNTILEKWIYLEADLDFIINNSNSFIYINKQSKGAPYLSVAHKNYTPFGSFLLGMKHNLDKAKCAQELYEFTKKIFYDLLSSLSEFEINNGVNQTIKENPILLHRFSSIKAALVKTLPEALKRQDSLYESDTLSKLCCEIENAVKKIDEMAHEFFNAALENSPKTSPSPPRQEQPRDSLLARAGNLGFKLVKCAHTTINYYSSKESHPALNLGIQLTSSYIEAYIDALSTRMIEREKPLLYNSLFSFSTIELFSIAEILSTIDLLKNLRGTTNSPIILPMLLNSKDNKWERAHIVLVTIEENTLYYFDSKAEDPAMIAYSPSLSLEKILELIRDALTSEGKIVANSTCMQYDVNNCGAYVCAVLERRFIKNREYEEIFSSEITIDEIAAIRKEVLTAWENKHTPSVESIVEEFEELTESTEISHTPTAASIAITNQVVELLPDSPEPSHTPTIESILEGFED